jgi:hypothetical protein
MPNFECELVLRHDGEETRLPHTFLAEIRPGTYIRIQGQDWFVDEIRDRETGTPEIICRPPTKRL